jgi:steroid delta-isomerase-like uncharacterized protein
MKRRGSMSTPNKSVTSRFTDELWNKKSLTIADELLSEDVTLHILGEKFRGREAWKERMGVFSHAFPDMEFTGDLLIAEGDKVVVHWSARGTHTEDLQGIPPTGKSISITGVGIFRLSEGKIIEMWSFPDMFSLLRQLGAIPSPAPVG